MQNIREKLKIGKRCQNINFLKNVSKGGQEHGDQGKQTGGSTSQLKEHWLTIATFIGVVLGIVLGVCLKQRAEPWTKREVMYISFVGDLFLNALKCIILPLIIPSLISAIGSLDLSLSGKIGTRAICYYMLTTVVAVILGIIVVSVVRPGHSRLDETELAAINSTINEKKSAVSERRNVTTEDTLMDLIRNAVPSNIIQATIQQYQTVIVYPGEDIDEGSSIDSNDKKTWEFKGRYAARSNILGLVVFSVVLGMGIGACRSSSKDGKNEGEPLLALFASISAVMMRITTWIIHFAPVGICFLIAGQILAIENLLEAFSKLGLYFITVILGLSIHGFLVLPLIYTLVTRQLPFKFILNMSKALITAFATASSTASLPVTIETLESKNGVHPAIAGFVLPIGATVNMDGTALYEAVAAIFIAQFRGVSLTLVNVIAISITSTAASIGAAGIPQAGLVTMIMVLDTVGLPAEDVALILAVDWLLDRFRTTINVLGDSIGAGIIDNICGHELSEAIKNSNIESKNKMEEQVVFEESRFNNNEKVDVEHHMATISASS